MKKRMLVIVIAAILFINLTGCGSKTEPNTGEITVKPTATAVPTPKTPSISDEVSAMTLDEKIGQIMMVGVAGYTNDENAKRLIDQYHVGGFVLLGHNIKDTQQIVDLINGLKETNKLSEGIPLFMAVDEEGGRVTRMPDAFIKMPASKKVGKINNPDFSYKIGAMLGTEAKALGYNIDFAPVLDINSNPKNPVIGDRAFGANPEIVTQLGIETMEGIRSQGIVSVVKHFPGHGDTSVDSHTGLPVVKSDLNRLREFELIPFKEAIKNNADMIMVAHILFPKIDPKHPASLSDKIITELLKKELKYEGLVITDDLTMGAIIQGYDIGEAAVMSVKAGTDIVLVCNDVDKEIAVFDALKAAVTSGEISEKDIDSKVVKIIALKQKYKMTDEKVEAVNVAGINKEIKALLEIME